MSCDFHQIIKSNYPSAQWRGDLTKFSGFYDVFPSSIIEQGGWDQITNFLAGMVAIGKEKDQLPYVVPCLLKDAPFTPKTLRKATQRALGSSGKQRSAAHVTRATWIVMDIDGLEEAEFSTKLKTLIDTECSFCIYTTHSHGREDKEGVRARLIVPVDQPLCAERYKAAWLGLDILMLGGAAAKLDKSGSHLWQQQGIHATTQERSHLAFSHIQKGCVWSAETLISAAPVEKKISSPERKQQDLTPSDYVRRILKAIPWMEANDTPTWHKAVTAFKATLPLIGEHDARELMARYSALGSEEARRLNETDRRYNPLDFFENVNPMMAADVGIAVLLRLARDGAVKAVLADQGKADWTSVGHEAAVYLCQHHRRTFEQLIHGK